MNDSRDNPPTRVVGPESDTALGCDAPGWTRVSPRAAAHTDDLDMETLGRALAGRYRLESVLGAGGMGQVFRAFDVVLDRSVALKTIRPEIVADPHWLDRFRFEATVAAGLQHPNIVQVYEILEVMGRPVLVMEYVDGADLTCALRAGALSEAEAVRIITAVCDALSFAHARGVIHRDIKPGNIMLGRDGVPKIADFGLATQRGRRVSTAIEEQEQGSLLGSPSYMSPEQARGDMQAIDNRTDIYSLGATFYFALTGRSPVRGGTVTEILRAVVTGDLRPPSQFRPGLSPDLEAICLKAMAPEPERRYGSAAAMAVDLRNLAANRPVSARHYSLWEMLRRAVGSRRGAFAAGVGAVVLAFIGIAAAVVILHSIAKSEVFEGMRHQVRDLASMTALMVDPRQVSAALEHPDPATPAVARLQALLTQARSRSPELRYVWIMARARAGPTTMLQFVADSGPSTEAGDATSAPEVVPEQPDELFDASRYPELLRGFEEPAADRDYTVTDQWGIALSGYAPINDASGRAAAVLGVDMSEADLTARFEVLDQALITTLVLSGALSFLALILVAVTITNLWSRPRFGAAL